MVRRTYLVGASARNPLLELHLLVLETTARSQQLKPDTSSPEPICSPIPSALFWNQWNTPAPNAIPRSSIPCRFAQTAALLKFVSWRLNLQGLQSWSVPECLNPGRRQILRP